MRSVKKHKNKLLLFVFLVLIVACVTGGIFLVSEQRKKADLASLVVETAQIRDIKQTVSSDGKLGGVDERTVYSPLNNIVDEIKVTLNQNVNKDDVLALVKQYNGKLYVFTEIKSPISGTVTDINVKAGDTITSTNSAVMNVVDKTSYKIDLSINENDIFNVKVGQKASIIYPAISLDQPYEGAVTEVAQSPIDTTSGSVNYKVTVVPSVLPDKLILGMSASVDITTAEVKNVLSLPESFIIERDSKHYVKTITWLNDKKDQYQIEEHEVTLGLQTNEYVEIVSGIEKGQEVVEPSFTTPRRFGFF